MLESFRDKVYSMRRSIDSQGEEAGAKRVEIYSLRTNSSIGE